MRSRNSKRVAGWREAALLASVAALLASVVLALIAGARAPVHDPVRSATPGPVRASLPRHFAGGFGIYTAPDAQSAAAAGVTAAFVYGSADPATAAALAAQGLPRVEAKLWSLLLRYECARLTRMAQTWQPCGGQDTIATEEELLGDVAAYLRSVQHDPRVVGYWILDDWPVSDPGGARALLLAITRLVHQLTPGRPTICGFGANFGPGRGGGFAPELAANYSPGACDMVALFIYSSSVSDPTIAPSSFDWSMGNVLPQAERELRARGWNGAKAPLIGVAQAWGGERVDVPGLYEIAPTAAELAEQSASYCRQGAAGIVYYAWSDSTVANMETPANSVQLAQGVQQGIAACQRVWARGV